MEYHLGGTAVQPPGRPLRSPCAASPWSPPSAASLVRYQSLGTGGDSLPLPPPPPGLHAQRCPGRGQGKAPGKRTAWCSLSACSGQPLGAADSQLDSGRSARANVTSPGGELSSQWGWGGGGVAPEPGIPSQSLIPARPLPIFPVPAPSCRAWNWVWGGLHFQSCLLQQAGRQARLSCTPSSPFLSLRAVPRAGLPAWVVRDQRWASQEEPSAKGRPLRIRPAAAGSATCLGPRGGHLGSQGCRVKAWAGKGREVGTFEAGSPWKSHGLKQELPTPQPPRAVLSASEAAGVPRTRLESPHLVQQAPTPKPSVLCFQLLLCPLGVGAPPAPVPYSR